MKIDLTEMMRIKGRLSDINSEMSGTFNGISQEFESISSNINSEGLHEAIVTIQENVSNLASLFSKNMSVLEEFMGQQLSSYTVTNEEASQALQNLISIVNQTFDQNGNVISTAALTAASHTGGQNNASPTTSTDGSTSTRRADPNIGDSEGYNTGQNKQDYFADKIGNSEAKWKVVDDTYYFFKDKGLSDEQIAGIIGNMTQESALDMLCPTGQYKGLFQWGKDRYPSDWDITTQLEHAWQEIQYDRSQGKVLRELSATTTVNDATMSFAKTFEGYTGEMPQRQGYANAVYYYIKNNL